VWSVELPPEPASATQARRQAREELASIFPPDALDTVALLVIELVTNAILHAREHRCCCRSRPDPIT
jgi:anti-sigma regulatory factor (Ser/Thr protein kinase)